MESITDNLPLGKKSKFEEVYNPSLLCGIERKTNREKLGIGEELPFLGVDIWNVYELSWLNNRGKPVVALAEIRVPCTTPCIVESKSLKLYLGSFNQTRFGNLNEVTKTIEMDLSVTTRGSVLVDIRPLSDFNHRHIEKVQGTCLDEMDVDVEDYHVNKDLLSVNEHEMTVSETVYSDLFRSNCPVTGQPDWATIVIHYKGKPIDHGNLLRYIISYRRHSDFHEQCVERMYMDVMEQCAPEALSVYARFTRRGGIDINPFRGNYDYQVQNSFASRQ